MVNFPKDNFILNQLSSLANRLDEKGLSKISNDIDNIIKSLVLEPTNLLPGGLGDDLDPKDVDGKQLLKGISVELEHTGNALLAKEIALDHLAEDPKYYDKLELIEDHAYDEMAAGPEASGYFSLV